MLKDSLALGEHLGELRRRLVWILLMLAATMIAGFFIAGPILEYFKQAEPASRITWNAFTPWDGLRVYLQVAFLISLVVTVPFTLYHLWSFVKPGLRELEQKAALRYIPYSVVLFFVGLGFAYFIVFPNVFKFTSTFNEDLDLVETYGIAQYFSFMFNILLPLSLLFELPVIIMFLTRLRLLKPMLLRKWRRYSYMLLLITATFVTPPDVISVLMVAIPLIVLYEASVILSGYIYSRQEHS
ncbi:twin-arginine translocase subunit TatC [Cohnella silvisoli]|uniref:Sec-independent protein translocase protein TatC n=1 Tax=Cohnella silvisoli TaxID=2873699 RepID=A0ABV1KRH3_9BACL|nr:twin-arginine translocase subunit TatC [Cohnella silvisoli]MCD9021679.1 twin-arginine translocase subunit TatC [Cohnella silvisoli]